MIVCQLESLNPVHEAALRTLLGRGEMQDLVRSAEAQQKHWECKYLEDSVAAKDFDSKTTSANENLRKAQKYATFLEILKQLTEQKEPHQIAKLT